ncbi:MAG: hypothetical protein AAGA66_02715 [Bacteroidota bacterium]
MRPVERKDPRVCRPAAAKKPTPTAGSVACGDDRPPVRPIERKDPSCAALRRNKHIKTDSNYSPNNWTNGKQPKTTSLPKAPQHQIVQKLTLPTSATNPTLTGSQKEGYRRKKEEKTGKKRQRTIYMSGR